MSQQVPQQPQPREISNSLKFFLGLGLGLIPVLVFLPALGAMFGTGAVGYFVIISLLLYVGVIVGATVCLIIQKTRYIGYGLLTMVFVGPIIAFISCTVVVFSA